jgi:hypothetical protein
MAFDVLGLVPSRDTMLLHTVLALLCVKSVSSVGVCGGRCGYDRVGERERVSSRASVTESWGGSQNTVCALRETQTP